MEIEVAGEIIRIEDERVEGSIRSKMLDYLNGEEVVFDEEIDLNDFAPFYTRALEKVREIPYGQTRTYGEIAEELGSPGGARAVSNALNQNPVPIVIPCHRVVAEDGIGGYKHGEEVKRRLLELEDAEF